jgi:PDZ domain-containing protein
MEDLMLNKIYDNFKKYIKENYKFIITMVLILVVFTLPTDYEVYTPGGVINTFDRIKIDGSTESKGSLNMTYVGAKKGTIPVLILSYIFPNWDIENLSDDRIEDESYEEIVERNKLSLHEVNKYSTIVAYKYAGKKCEIIKEDVTIYYVSDEADTSLKLGDIIKSVNGKNIENLTQFQEIITNAEIGDKLNLIVERDNNKETAYAVAREEDGKKMIGIYLISILDIKTEPKIDFIVKNNESGSSGGLMNALTIYDMLVEEDITKGLKISGTGTIDRDGNVGEIAGVKYKLAGAVKNKSDVFIVPSANYDEAIKEKKKNKYKIDIIKADTFENVLKILKNM